MDVVTAPAPMRAWTDARRRHGERVALVPTMGALHDGHLSLVDIARRAADHIVVSIFVNPIQFDQAADFDAYPRPIDDDLARCAEIGVATVYAPTAAVMYPPGFETHVEPGPLAAVMEGAMRPGHFRGVTTVVTKLFAAVRPDVAVFGEKDFQQLAVVRRMTADLDLGVEILAGAIVRESDGLAMSSRNARLGPADRQAAVCIPRALEAAAAAAASGERDAARLAAAARAVLDTEPRAAPEYVAVFDPSTLAPLDRLAGPARIAVAVWFGDVRLIDNRALPAP